MHRRIRHGPLFLMVVSGACLVAWRLVPRERLLLEHARRIANTTHWGEGARRFNISIHNHWLSDHEILFDRYEGPQRDQRVIYKRNIETGQETKLPGLTAIRRQLGEEVVDAECVSPDGKWYVGSARWGRCLLAEVNGTRHSLYPYAAQGDHRRFLLWLPDARHWLERYYLDDSTYRLILHDTQNPKASVKLSMEAESTAANMKMIAAPDNAVLIEWPAGDINEFGEPIVKPNAPPTKQVTISLMPWRAKSKPFAVYSLAMPSSLRRYDLVISPKADRVAWYVDMNTESPFYAWLHRYVPSIKSAL